MFFFLIQIEGENKLCEIKKPCEGVNGNIDSTGQQGGFAYQYLLLGRPSAYTPMYSESASLLGFAGSSQEKHLSSTLCTGWIDSSALESQCELLLSRKFQKPPSGALVVDQGRGDAQNKGRQRWDSEGTCQTVIIV